MVLLALAAASAATGGAMTNVFGYNRDAWMTDISMDQTRRYQRQAILMSQADMFRDDIRDLAGACVTKQSNYVLISTLTLGFVADIFVNGPLPDKAAEFMRCVFALCVGSALLYLVLAIMCSVTATNLATNCQRDLLTRMVRVPVDEMVAEVDSFARHENAEAFEHLRLERMLRIPGWSRVRSTVNRHSPSPDVLLGSAPRSSNIRGPEPPRPPASSSGISGLSSSRSEPGGHAAPPLRSEASGTPRVMAGSLVTEKANKHLAMFKEREKEWDVLGSFSLVFNSLGANHLLQAWGYFSAARWYTRDDFASGIVHILIVFINAMFARVSLTAERPLGWFGAFVNMLGPLLAQTSMRTHLYAIDAFAIPGCFVCHCLWATVGSLHVRRVAHQAVADEEAEEIMKQAVEAQSQEAPEADAAMEMEAVRQRRADLHRASVASSTSTSSFFMRQSLLEDVELGSRSSQPRTRARAASAASGRIKLRCWRESTMQRRYGLIFIGNTIVMLGWYASLFWAIFHAFNGDPNDGGNPDKPDPSLEKPAADTNSLEDSLDAVAGRVALANTLAGLVDPNRPLFAVEADTRPAATAGAATWSGLLPSQQPQQQQQQQQQQPLTEFAAPWRGASAGAASSPLAGLAEWQPQSMEEFVPTLRGQAQTLPVSLPSAHFRPHSLTCTAAATEEVCIMANEHLLFELRRPTTNTTSTTNSTSSAPSSSSFEMARRLPCPLSGHLGALARAPSGRPEVLLHDAHEESFLLSGCGDSVLSTNAVRRHRLLPMLSNEDDELASEALDHRSKHEKRIAAVAFDMDDPHSLFALHGTKVSQYQSDPFAAGAPGEGPTWSPMWSILEAERSNTVHIELATTAAQRSDSRGPLLFLIAADGTISSYQTSSGKLCKRARLPLSPPFFSEASAPSVSQTAAASVASASSSSSSASSSSSSSSSAASLSSSPSSAHGDAEPLPPVHLFDESQEEVVAASFMRPSAAQVADESSFAMRILLVVADKPRHHHQQGPRRFLHVTFDGADMECGPAPSSTS